MYYGFCFVAAFLLFACAEISAECRIPTAPRFGRVHCSTRSSNKMTCTVRCKTWSIHIGAREITCDNKTGQFDSVLPICYPDYARCSKRYPERCPKLTKEDLVRYQEQNLEMSSDEKEAIELIVNEHLSRKMTRNSTKGPCTKSMCKLKCVSIPIVKVANICRHCRKKKLIRCPRGGSLF